MYSQYYLLPSICVFCVAVTVKIEMSLSFFTDAESAAAASAILYERDAWPPHFLPHEHRHRHARQSAYAPVLQSQTEAFQANDIDAQSTGSRSVKNSYSPFLYASLRLRGL